MASRFTFTGQWLTVSSNKDSTAVLCKTNISFHTGRGHVTMEGLYCNTMLLAERAILYSVQDAYVTSELRKNSTKGMRKSI